MLRTLEVDDTAALPIPATTTITVDPMTANATAPTFVLTSMLMLSRTDAGAPVPTLHMTCPEDAMVAATTPSQGGAPLSVLMTARPTTSMAVIDSRIHNIRV